MGMMKKAATRQPLDAQQRAHLLGRINEASMNFRRMPQSRAVRAARKLIAKNDRQYFRERGKREAAFARAKIKAADMVMFGTAADALAALKQLDALK